MKLLAIDTSASACSLAILNESDIHSTHQKVPMQQAQRLLPLLASLLQTANLELNQLDGVAFGCGPGSFTGVRIATSTAQGLGFAAQLPLIPISSLAGLAQAAYEELGWKNLLVAVDARINEVYWGAYQVNQHGLMELKGKEHVSAPQDIQLAEGHWCGVGDAWSIYHDKIPFKPQKIDAGRLPMAIGILTLAKAKMLAGEIVRPADALPTYLRDDVAKPSK